MAKKKTYGKSASGVPLTEEMIERLSDQAEAGYDVDEIIRRRPGRPAMGSAPARVESVRLDPELRSALSERSDRDGRPISAVIRDALRNYLSPAPAGSVAIGSAEATGEIGARVALDSREEMLWTHPAERERGEVSPHRMREITPRTPDPDRVVPPQGAEPIISSTFILELPFSLRVPELQFVVSHPGMAWDGWGADEIGHLLDVAANIPEGYEPQFRIAMNQAQVEVPPPLQAARAAFPGWDGFPAEGAASSRDSMQYRTIVLVSAYTRFLETPFGDGDDRALTEWLSRRFDDALGLLNDYLVILAAMHDEWHISRISRADLPRTSPFHLDIRPTPGGSTSSHSTLDVHATFRDDLPVERDADEVLAAVDLIKAYREGRAPFWEWVQYYQAAEHHLGSGRYDQAVIAATTAMEVLVNVFFREVWEALQLEPKKLEGVLRCGFRNQLTKQLPRFLDRDVELDNTKQPPGRWFHDCYLVRNRTVHEGGRPNSAEAMDAKVATRAFVAWIGSSMKDDERTARIRAILSSPVGERRG